MRLSNARVFAVVVFSSAFPAWGCSSTSAAPPGTIVGNGAATSQSITPAGGTVTLQGSIITIPAGAVSSTQTITIQSTTSPPPAGVTNLSPIYQFGPSGLTFDKPVTIQLSFTSNGHAAVLAWTDPNAATFSVLASAVSGSTLTGQVTHFSQGFVADGTTTASLAPPGDGGGSTAGNDATVATDDAGPPASGEDGGPPVDATLPFDDGAAAADAGEEDAGLDAGDAAGDYGVRCTHPGGSDPACTGTYDLCENYLNNTYCTKACTYPDGSSGLANDPTDCPLPAGRACTPQGFCR